jgi:hypothetical protein
VLAVPAARQQFSRQVAKGFHRKLPSIKPRSNQPALWTPSIYIYISLSLIVCVGSNFSQLLLWRVLSSGDINTCSPFKVNRRFGGTYCFHFQYLSTCIHVITFLCSFKNKDVGDMFLRNVGGLPTALYPKRRYSSAYRLHVSIFEFVLCVVLCVSHSLGFLFPRYLECLQKYSFEFSKGFCVTHHLAARPDPPLFSKWWSHLAFVSCRLQTIPGKVKTEHASCVL